MGEYEAQDEHILFFQIMELHLQIVQICKIIEIMRYLKSERSLNSQHRTKNIIQI